MKLAKIIVEGKVYNLSFDTSSDTDNKNIYSVIIGANAKGKSRLLSNIANSFRRLHDKRTGKNLKEEAILTYHLNEKKHEVNLKEDINYGLFESVLPASVISISNSMYDKFPLAANSDLDFYSYIGARDSGLDNERHAIYSLMDTIQEICAREDLLKKARHVFDLLNLDYKIKIDLKTNRSSSSKIYQTIFSKNITAENLKEQLSKLGRVSKINRGQHTRVIKELEDKNYVKGLVAFIKENRSNIIVSEHTDENQKFIVNLGQPQALKVFFESYKYFTFLRKLNVVSYNQILISKKKGKSYDILDSSSGEISLLTSFIRALPKLKSDSLILIDEPEISLHPNWQIEYMNKLNELLIDHKNCHVIIATHSPYIVSDSNPNNSYLVKIDEMGSEILPESPFCRSVEDILWNIFKVPSTRNYFLANEVGDILKTLAKKNKSTEEVQFLQNNKSKLSTLQTQLLPEDPTRKVISLIVKRISDVN